MTPITRFVQWPSYPHLSNASQGDYPMTDAFHLQPEPEESPTYEFPTHPDDLQDYRSETCHMVILEKLQAATANNQFQVVTNHAATPGYSVQIPICGNEVSQSSRYWEFIQTPQLIPPGQSGGVCQWPTSLPPGPNPTSEPRILGPFEVVSTEAAVTNHPWFSHNTTSLQFPVATTPTAALLLTSDFSPEGSQRTRIGSELARLLSLLSHSGDVDVSLSRPLPD